jgi:hypothetical protein
METPRRTKKRRIDREVTKALQKIQQSTPLQEIQQSTPLQECHEHDPPDLPNDRIDFSSITGNDNNINFDCNNLHAVSESSIDLCSETLVSKVELLRIWALNHNITQSALNGLLGLVTKWLPSEGFPNDSRTLLKTPRKIVLSEICGGQFYHFGLAEGIVNSLKSGMKEFRLPNLDSLRNISDLLTVKIGIDGLPISKSSNKQFWPILCSVDQSISSRPFIVSLFLWRNEA